MRTNLKRYQAVSLAVAFFAACVATGCSVLTPTDPYQFVVPPFISSEPSSVAGHQVSAQPDIPGITPGITLDRAVEIAVANSPMLAAAAFDADAALARSQSARGALWPRFSAEAGYTRYQDDQRLVAARYNGEPGAFGDDLFSGDMVLRVPLFAGGKLVNEMRAADFLRQSAVLHMARTREELIFNVSSVFYSILAQKRLIQSLEFSADALDGHLKRINDLINAQKAARVDRLRTEVRLSDVRQKLVRGKNVLTIQHRLLAALMGIHETGTEIRVAGSLEQSAPETPPLESSIKSALEHRPDYGAARKEMEAQARRVDAARGANFPTVNLFGTYGMRWAANPDDQPPHVKDSEDAGKAGIAVEMPLFEGGRIRARIREEQSSLDAARQRLRQLELNIRLEVETVLANMTSAVERLQTMEIAIEQAQESLRIERKKYELGRGAILDVLDAQAALMESETNYYQALADLNIANAQLRLSTGESFK